MFFKPSRKNRAATAPLILSRTPAPGIFAGTKVATLYDWTPVEALRVGDKVLTAQDGEQTITGIDCGALSVSSSRTASEHWPVQLPEGVIGNAQTMTLSPEMWLVIEDPAAGRLFGETVVTLQASSLIGYRCIARARASQPMIHVTLEFEHAVTLVVQGGVFLDIPTRSDTRRFTPLNARQARQLVRHMHDEDTTLRSGQISAG